MSALSTSTTVTTYKFYIDGEWIESKSGQTVDIYSPYSLEVIGKVQAITTEEVDKAVHFAQGAQRIWKEVSLQERAQYLYKWADELVNMQEEIAEVIMKEVGKSLKDAKNEVVRTADFIRYTVGEALHMHGESMKGDSFPGGSKSKIAIVERVPLGVVLATGLGIEAIHQGYKVSFISMGELIHTLKTEEFTRKSQTRMKRIRESHLVIIDDLMYMAMDTREANLFFHLINDLYDRASVIITSNKGPQEWGELLGDPGITTAILDRLIHRAEVIHFREEESYRMKHRSSIFGEESVQN